MRIDELTRELEDAAAEIGPLDADARTRTYARARRRRGRRVAATVAGVVLVTGAVAAGFALTGGGGKVGIVTEPPGESKEVAADRLLGPEAYVALDTDDAGVVEAVREVLERSPAVERYAVLPQWRQSDPLFAFDPEMTFTWQPDGEDVACAFAGPAFSVALDAEAASDGGAVGDLRAQVRSRAGREVRVGAFPEPMPGWDEREGEAYDAEVYALVVATPEQVQTLFEAVSADPDVASARLLTKEDAYQEFQRMFRGDPDLTGSVSPEVLPASIRIEAREGADLDALGGRLGRLPNVDAVEAFQVSDPAFLRAFIPGGTRAEATMAEVFLLDAGDQEIAAVRSALESSPEVARIEFVSQQDAYEEYLEMFSDDPDLVASISPDTMPVSFRLELGGPPTDTAGFETRIGALPGVADVEVGYDCPPT